MDADNKFKDYFLVGTRTDPESGMCYEIHAKRIMTDDQIDQEYLGWSKFVKSKVSRSAGTFRIWVEDAAFDQPKDKTA